MSVVARASLALLLCFPLTGCYVKSYAIQSTSNGQSSTATSTQVSGSASFANGRASFSSGQVPPSGAPGGQASFSKGGSVVLVAAIVIADFLNSVGLGQPKPLPADAKIMGTCSCFKKEESDEIRVTR
jgi:hypothetical protein